MHGTRFPTALAALTLLAATASAQELVHHAQGIERRLSQSVRMSETWEESTGQGIFLAEPRDVETRVITDGPRDRRVEVQLLMHGDWGWFHFAYDEVDIRQTEPVATGLRTLRLATDVDGDDQHELVLIERRASTQLPLDERGEPAGGAVPLFGDYQVTVRYLDRKDGSLVEKGLSGDPEEAGFAKLLATELGGAANAALQLLAGDQLFTQKRYAEARSRYQAASEWAERSLAGQRVDELAVDMTLGEPDPDSPEFTWIVARMRQGALPPYFQRRY